MYENVKINPGLLSASNPERFITPFVPEYVLEYDGLTTYDGVEYSFDSWTRQNDPNIEETNLCIYLSSMKDDEDSYAYYMGRKEFDGQTYDMWRWDLTVQGHGYASYLLTDIITVESLSFNFGQYCPTINHMLKPLLKTQHATDVIGLLTGQYPATEEITEMLSETVSGQTSSSPGGNPTSFITGGSTYYLQRMAYSSNSQKYTYVRSYNIYAPASNTKVLLSPFYYSGINYCNPGVRFSHIYPNSYNGDSSNKFNSGQIVKSVYLPKFTISASGQLTRIDKVYGPYSCNLNTERVTIIWNRDGNTIGPKYFIRYGATNVTSNCGGSIYGPYLISMIEIE